MAQEILVDPLSENPLAPVLPEVEPIVTAPAPAPSIDAPATPEQLSEFSKRTGISLENTPAGITAGDLTSLESLRGTKGATPWDTIPLPESWRDDKQLEQETGERPATRAEIAEANAERGDIDVLFDLPASDIADVIETEAKSGVANPLTLAQGTLARRDQWDDEFLAKMAETHRILKTKGFSPSGLGFKKLAPMAVDFVKGTGNWIGNAAYGVTGVPAFTALEAALPGETPAITQQRLMAQRSAAETVAASTASVEHVAGLPAKIADKLFGKDPAQWTPEESAKSLAAEMAENVNTENTLAGGGDAPVKLNPEVREEMKRAGLDIRPAEAAASMAGDPLGFMMFGKGLGLVGQAFKVPGIALRAAKLAGRGAETEAAIVASLPKHLQGAMVGHFEREAAKRGVLAEVSKAGGELVRAGMEKVAPIVGAVERGVAAIPTAQTVVGKGIQATGAVADWLGKWAEKVAPVAVPLAGAISAGTVSGGLSGLAQATAALVGGGGALSFGLRPALATLRASRKIAQAIGYSGKSVAAQTAAEIAEAPIRGTASAIIKAGTQSVPDAIAGTLHGAALDIPLAALTISTPEDQTVLQLGTILGIGQGLRKTVARTGLELKTGARDWGHDTKGTTSGSFPALERMSNDAFTAAPRGVQRRANATQQLLKSVDTDADFFMADPSHVENRQVGTAKIGDTTHVKWKEVNTDVERALLEMGATKESAEFAASQNGFFEAHVPVPGQPGKTKRVIVVTNIDSAPHEAKHAFQNVIGEQANQALDKVVRNSFDKPTWDFLGQDYTRKLLGRRLTPGEKWQHVILDVSGDGNAAAELKLKLHAVEALEAQQGAAATREQIDALKPVPGVQEQGGWRSILTPAEQLLAADKYIAREIAAETFDTVFKHLGPALKERGGLINTFAKFAARVVELLGGDSLAGARSEVLGVPIKAPIVGEILGQVRGRQAEVAARKPVVTPELKGNKPAPTANAPIGTPEQEAEITRKVAETAPEQPTGPEPQAQSQQAVLGVFAEAKARRGAAFINRRQAPGTRAGAITITRGNRREQIEIARSLPDDLKPLAEKLFTPVKTVVLKDGSLQEQGWDGAVVASNAEKTARGLSEANATVLSPFEIDVATKSFTDAGWRDLFAKLQIYSGNQAAGLTGKGTPLDIGAARDLGFFEPTGNRVPVGKLTDAEANFLSYLVGFPLPGAGKSVLARGGKAQYGVQLISEATAPGRAQPLVEPRTFGSKQAEQLGFAGEQLKEVNPLRAEIEAAARKAGIEPPSLIEAWQNLNVRDIVSAELAPEQTATKFVATTARAGFQPKPRAITDEEFARESALVQSALKTTGYGPGTAKAPARETEAQRSEKIRAAVALTGGGPAGTKAFQPKPGEETLPRLGKTFDEFVAGFRAAVQEGQPELAQGFLEKAAGAAKFQRTLARKGDVSEFGDRTIDEEFTAQEKQVQELGEELAQSKKEANVFLDRGLAAKVFDAGGKLKENPPQQSMEGTGLESNAELVEKYLADEGSQQPGWYPTFYAADRSQGKWKVTELQLAAEIADSPNPIATLNAHVADIPEVARHRFRESILNHIYDFETIKNERRIKAGYFGKRAPFSQIRRPGRTKFQPKGVSPIKAAAVRDESGKIFEGLWHGEAYMKAQEAPGVRGVLEDGFVGQNGEWYNRQEAADVAVRAKQITQEQAEAISAENAGEGLESNRFENQRAYAPMPANARAVKSPAVKDESGKVFEGIIHAIARDTALESGSKGPFTDGFTTNTPKEFLDRDQAFARAKEIKQLPVGQLQMPGGGLESQRFAEVRKFQLRPTREDAAEDFSARVDKNRAQVMREFLSRPKDTDRGVSWSRVPAARLKKIWLDFGKYKVLRDEKGIEDISEQVLENISRIKAITELVGHETYDVKDMLENEGIELTDKQWDKFYNSDFITNQYSDYALRPLEALYEQLYRAETPEQKLFTIDRILNVIHQRGDIADLFVQGGTKTLNEIAAQGGPAEGHEWNEQGKGQNELVRKYQPVPERKEIEIEGPDGKKYKALFDGYQDASILGLGQIAQITPLVDLPGSVGARSTTYGPTLEKAGYKLPELQPKEITESPEQDFELEKAFADALIKGSKSLEEFPYYEDYSKTIEAEAPLLGKANRVLFIGGGPVPISPILLSQKLGVPVRALDISKEAVGLGNKVAKKLGAEVSLTQGSAEDFKDYGKYDAIVLALEAGTTEGKKKIFDIIAEQAKPETKILVRGSVSEGEFPTIPKEFQRLQTISTFGGQGESAIIKFAPKKKKEADPLKLLGTQHGSASKAWILPNGDVKQLGAQWHHDWLSENPEVQAKYGIKAPKFEGVDDDATRGAALKKGFARVNLDNGVLTVEVREKNWKNVRPILEDLIEKNLDDVDRFRVGLLNETATDLNRTISAKLFDADTNREKMDRVFDSLSEEGQREIGRETAFAPKTDAGKELEKEGFRFRVKTSPDTIDIELMPKGKRDWVGSMFAEINPETKTAKVGSVKVEQTFQNRGIGETLYRELASHLQELGITNLEGDVISAAPMKIREKLFGGSEVLGEKSTAHGGYAKQVRSEISPTTKFAPKQSDFENPETIREALSSPGWAIVTGTQEKIGGVKVPWNDPRNLEANAKLKADLEDKGYDFFPVEGKYKGESQGESFAVLGISTYDAQALGKKYKQESVITPKGLLYGDGTITPGRPEDTLLGKDAAKEEFYSVTPEGLKFSIPLDFDKNYQAVGEQSQLFGGREYESPAGFTQAELKQRHPEAIVPKNSKEKIDSDIVGSPLYKKSENPVNAFADKLVEFANQHKDSPNYQMGLRWYSDFAPLLKKEFGKDAPMMAELLAASSPNEKPDMNFYYAVDALEGFKSGRFDKIVSKFNEGFDMYKSDNWLTWYNKELKAGNIPNPPKSPTPEAFLAHWVYKNNLKPKQSNGQLFGFHGRAILEVMARKWLEENEGPKVANFVQNLQQTGEGATIDVWADRTMRRLGYGDSKDRWRILPKNGTGVSDADFAFAQKAFKAAADKLGIRPDALQGGLWFAEKQLWSDNGWGRLDLGSYVVEMQKLPLIRQAIKQRLSATKQRAKIAPMESGELKFQPKSFNDFSKIAIDAGASEVRPTNAPGGFLVYTEKGFEGDTFGPLEAAGATHIRDTILSPYRNVTRWKFPTEEIDVQPRPTRK